MKILNNLIWLLLLSACGVEVVEGTEDETVVIEVAATTPTPTTYINLAETIPKPVFQLGDTVSEPFADSSSEAEGFIKFFNQTYPALKNHKLKNYHKQDVVWFPPQAAGDTNLESVARVTEGEESNCDAPDGYPILCEDQFSTGEFCKACHDSVLFVEGGGLAQMAYFSEPYPPEAHEVWLANWSQYGDWSANIMRLAARDPIWQAQIETETNIHKFVDPAVIQDVCFSCHGEMGERQLKNDLGADQLYCTDLFYATIPGILSDKERGKPYPFTGDCQPIANKSIAEHQDLYAKYGSLARDGVSCETCHRIGPENGDGNWNGTDFQVFYGRKDIYNVELRQPFEQKAPLEYELTANFQYDMHNILTPDARDTLDHKPMKDDDNLEIAQGLNQKDGVSYFRQAVLCSTCHVLIVPKIPSNFKPGGPLPSASEYPYYEKPDDSICAPGSTYAPATKIVSGKNGEQIGLGNPVTDNCVGLGYEQATYLEWINSSFASEKDDENTCQACHMPLVTDPLDRHNHKAIMAQSTKGLEPKQYRRHRLMGINLPVFEMFMQFPDVLGVSVYDDLVPPSGSVNGKQANFIQHYLLNGQMAIVEQATSQANGNGLKPDGVTPDKHGATKISIDALSISNNQLVADLSIFNNTGHKFPSGAGFRRAFIQFEVLDNQGKLIWVSGQTNAYGAICEGICEEQGSSGKYNLLDSEVPNGDPSKLQPHYQVITQQNQVQIYEVQAVNDDGKLTGLTLSLFYDAKDNRLLPRGFKSAKDIGCRAENNYTAGTMIFGINQCSAAYATEPQMEPLTVNSAITMDMHYSDSTLAGADTISYQIPLSDIKGTPASVRVTMEYQTIPPGYLAGRFAQGYSENKKGFLPAMERSIYLTSHLNTNLDLKSELPENADLTFSNNWTMSLYQVAKPLTQ